MSGIDQEIAPEFLGEIRAIFRSQKQMIDKTLAQLSNEELFWQHDPESNSIAIIIKHLGGNMISRWTDFLTTDGEKPNRNRDGEFITDKDSAESIKQLLAQGYQVFFATIDSITTDDLLKTILIRNEPHTVIKALQRQVSHYGYHVGQIVYIAKQIKQEDWQTLSIARGASNDYLVTAPKAQSSS